MKVSKKIRVLYADDKQDGCFILSVLLGYSNVEVVTANTTAETLRLMQTEPFDFYLLDLRFAQGDGVQLCRKLRKYSPHTPLLLTYMNQTTKKRWRETLIPTRQSPSLAI